MRIDANSPAASLLSADWSKPQETKSVLFGAESAREDRTTFSPASNMVQALAAQALKMPEVRQDRIEAVRESVSSGTYPLDAIKTAAAIVDSGEE